MERRFFVVTQQRSVEGVRKGVVQTAAEVAHTPQEKRQRETYRLALVTHRGEIPLTLIYSSGYEPKAEWAGKIDSFVSDPAARRLFLVMPPSTVLLLLALFCAGMAVLFVETTHGLLDKTTHSLRLVRWGVTGRKSIELPLSQVAKFTLAGFPERRNPGYRIIVELTEAPSVQLQKFSSFRLAAYRQRVDRLNAFLSRAPGAKPAEPKEANGSSGKNMSNALGKPRESPAP